MPFPFPEIGGSYSEGKMRSQGDPYKISLPRGDWWQTVGMLERGPVQHLRPEAFNELLDVVLLI